jgi:hypothetical protein
MFDQGYGWRQFLEENKMTLSTREMLYVKTCALVVALLAVALLVLKPLREKWIEAKSLNEEARIKYDSVKGNVNALTAIQKQIGEAEEKLHVKVQKGSLDQQRQQFIQAFEETAKKNKVVVSSLLPQRTSSRVKGSSSKGGGTAAYRVTADTDQAGLVNFLKAMRESGFPIVITSIDVKADSGNQGKLRILLELYTYLFEGTAS